MAMILELGSSQEWIRVTAEYSNAVLVAVLPYFSDFAQKLDLPVPHPIRMGDVARCAIVPYIDSKRGVHPGIQLNNGWSFGFDDGYVSSFTGPRAYYGLQDPAAIPSCFGEVRMREADAVQMARDTIRKMGIPLEAVFAEQEPVVQGPTRIGTNTVPRYLVGWRDPRMCSPPAGQAETLHLKMEINAELKRVESFSVLNRNLKRPPPKIDAVPPPDPRYPPWPQVNPAYAWRLILIVLRAIDDYGVRLSLPISRPLTTNHVARFSVADNGGWPHCEIELTNGWCFIYRNSMVNGFYAPDDLFSLFSEHRPIRVKDFLGEWKMGETAAIRLIRATLAKLNYPSNLVHMDFMPLVVKPALAGIPRCSFWWHFLNEQQSDLESKVEAEVDMDKGELKSLYFDDKAFWRKPPPIDVPIALRISAGTNATLGTVPAKRQVGPKPAERPRTSFRLPQEKKPR